MKELYPRAEWHFVCEGGCIFIFGSCPHHPSHSPLHVLHWLSETSHDLTWIWLCLLVCIDFMEFLNSRCLFSALTRGTSWDIGLIWKSNNQDQISCDSVCVCVCDRDSEENANTAGRQGDNSRKWASLVVWHFSVYHLFIFWSLKKLCSSQCCRIRHKAWAYTVTLPVWLRLHGFICQS